MSAMAPATIPDARWADDYRRVAAILADDVRTWHAFVDEYSDRVLATALSWCRPGCFCACAFDGRRTGLLGIFHRQDCDEVSDACLFILDKIRFVSLPSYQGRCTLNTFLFPLFHPSHGVFQPPSPGTGQPGRGRYGYNLLFAEFLRQKHGRIRPPKAVEEIGDLPAKVFVQVCYGRDDREIAFHLRLSPQDAAELPGVRARIDEVLRDQGWRHYWQALGHRDAPEVNESSLANPDPEGGGFDLEDLPGMHNTEQEALTRVDHKALWAAIDRLSTRTRAVLRLRFQQGYTAKQIGEALGLPMGQVYRQIDLALENLRVALPREGE